MEKESCLEGSLVTKISKEDILKIARISHIKINDSEIDALTNRLEQVLSYAARVQEIGADFQVQSSKNINVFRDDVQVPFDSHLIMNRAPECQENYFVVPAILDSSK